MFDELLIRVATDIMRVDLDTARTASAAWKASAKDNRRYYNIEYERRIAAERRVAELETVRKKENGRIIELLKENSALQVRVVELEELLDEWTNTPFFENQDEWLEWVNEYGPRVEATLNKSK